MRERSTWNLQEIAIAKKAADKRAAEVAGDVYSMNQDHPQPAMDEYVIGDSSDFAEDVHEPNTWEAEYSNGQTKRNEVGMPDMRSDTFNHAEKTAADRVRLKKAELCVAVAKLMLGGTKIASVDSIEDQAFALMFMPDQELINTHKRLAAEQQEQEVEEDVDEDVEDDSDDDSDDVQDKQAGEIPEAFKENIQKMKDKAKDKAEDEDDGEKKQAGEIPDFIQEKIDAKEEKKDEGEKKQAKSKKTSDQGLKEPKNEGGDQNAKANDNWPTKSANTQLAQMQQMMAQLQQMLQQAQGQGQAPAQQQAPVMAQGDELDQMLAQDDCGPMAEVDIELEPAPMDTENIVLAGEDEILRTLFAQDEQVEEEEEQVQQAQEKQAAVRTASTRTVGTRPTSGVAKLGGSASKTASVEADKLSSLWQSAPDVRDAFGLK